MIRLFEGRFTFWLRPLAALGSSAFIGGKVAFFRSLVSMRFCSERATGRRSISYSR